ncbi:MAG: 16S rRNA (adenine(1518)-N(6)/adenine(1519)-N(6))-dimethyltransferase RsmA [Firmicutes bacterium]|nr:16S rRNA (adenine(1518)-N(6)/adenine(1519)-N(6))-dimethyltransferase RsmA [Bacillota bacterium]
MKLYEPSTIKKIREEYGFKFSKSLGQNFLTDKNIIDEIVYGAGIGQEDTVLEIGPGIGVITYEAAKLAKKVIAVEIDKSLLPILAETLSEYDNVKVINEDILKLDINKLIEDEGMKNVKIMGNLPYYITTPIIMKILEEGVKASSITIMMQKEVADRIKAGPGTKAYGALSVAVQYYCTVDKVASVPRSVFVPQPNVDSIVLRLNIRSEKAVKLDNEKLFFDCVKAGFGQRRKTLLNSLQKVNGVDKNIVMQSLASAGIDESRRAETLTIEEFALIANEVNKRL